MNKDKIMKDIIRITFTNISVLLVLLFLGFIFFPIFSNFFFLLYFFIIIALSSTLIVRFYLGKNTLKLLVSYFLVYLTVGVLAFFGMFGIFDRVLDYFTTFWILCAPVLGYIVVASFLFFIFKLLKIDSLKPPLLIAFPLTLLLELLIAWRYKLIMNLTNVRILSQTTISTEAIIFTSVMILSLFLIPSTIASTIHLIISMKYHSRQAKN